ncbi:MAG TPA: DUF4810 domain-containing protein [Planctomycetota bacterium]|nr:DUF4810 domain-containing protein [Planctomycetota bacterium]
MRRLVLLIALLASSCISNRWHDFDTSSQNVVMDPTEQRYNEHIELLESWAADGEQPMPPGLYAELAYWLAKVGRFPEAEAALQKELAAYPQAQQFVAALRALVIPDDFASKPAPDEPAPSPAPAEVKP